MRLKKSYIAVAALIMLIIVTRFLLKEKPQTGPAAQPEKQAVQKQEGLQDIVMEYTQQLPAIASAITVVHKPLPQKEAFPKKEEQRIGKLDNVSRANHQFLTRQILAMIRKLNRSLQGRLGGKDE